MTVIELYDMVEEYYGYKIQMRGLDSNKQEVKGVLYESFVLKCNIDDRYGRFGGAFELREGYVISRYLGKECSLNCDPQSIKNSLAIMDEYCRMRLPDKFLEAYEKAYKH